MLGFDAGSFSDLAETSTGKRLWKFLNSDETLSRLKMASDLRRPALEGMQYQILEEFGEEVRVDRWKQMIGKMVRQVMEAHGYNLDQAGVRIRESILFTRAARYRKNEKIDREAELRSEYGLKSLRARKLGPSRRRFGTVVRLEDDVAEVFPNAESVNEALRFLIRVTKDSQPTLRKGGREAVQKEIANET